MTVTWFSPDGADYGDSGAVLSLGQHIISGHVVEGIDGLGLGFRLYFLTRPHLVPECPAKTSSFQIFLFQWITIETAALCCWHQAIVLVLVLIMLKFINSAAC